MALELRTCVVGPWPMNSYALVCPETRRSVLIDPGAEPEQLLAMLAGTTPVLILLTHTHADHIGALDEMRTLLDVPVLAHPGPYVDGASPAPEHTLTNGDLVRVGHGTIRAIYTPGHTADMITYMVVDGTDLVVGDTLFEGGPGRTGSSADFQTTLETLRSVVLGWPDDSRCHPGHGPSFRLGDRRARIEAFLARDHGAFSGDAEW